MSRRCVIKKYIRKITGSYLSDISISKKDLLMICTLALIALGDKEVD